MRGSDLRRGDTGRGARAEASRLWSSPIAPNCRQICASGVPEPELVDDPGARWRSRFEASGGRSTPATEDYIALRGEPRTRLRYLLALFAKEVALRAHGVPG